jgi:large repetitive protein
VNDRGRPAWPPSTRAALLRSLGIAAAACALAAAPAAAYVLQKAAVAGLTVKISSHPPAASQSVTAKFAWKTTGGPTAVSCRLDSGAYKKCTRSHSYTKLKQGLHTFTVRGSKGSTSRKVAYKWRVDTVAPTAPAVTGGSASWTAAAVTISGGGSADKGGSGVASYQHRSSANGGTSWSTAVAGASAKITANGTTWVQFRALDKAGNASAWAPAAANPAATATIDTVAPSLPTLTGGSTTWQDVASMTVQPAGAPTDSESGFAGYQYRTSSNGGTTWSAATPGTAATISAEGLTLVQFRSVDAVGNASAWVKGTVSIDRTAPTAPTDTGGSTSWQVGPTVTVTAAGSTDAGSGVTGYEYETSTNGGSTWSAATAGSSAAVSAQGTTLVQFAALDRVGLVSPWTQATVKLDLTAPSAPTVAGGSSTWVNAASGTVTASASTDSGGSGLSGYQYRTSSDAGTTWSAPITGASDLVSAEANTWVQFRSVDTAGNMSAWTPAAQTAGATVRLDRTAPTTPVASGGSAGWSNAASITVTATSTDAGSGVKSYQHETSTNGGTTWSAPAAGASVVVSATGQTLVQFQATDNVNLTSAWSGITAGGTVQLDRTNPTAPSSVTGGSASWQATAPVTMTASGSTDAGGSGLSGYQYRTSTDGGSTWSAAVAAPAAITGDGTTIVQMRAIDGAGNVSAWAPSSAGLGNTVKIDTTPPTAPVVAGGTSGWSAAASATVSASGSTDMPGSGVSGYQYETSTNGGTTWSPVTAGPSVTISAEGTTMVRFAAVDVALHVSSWVQTSVQLDRTAPSAPAAAGGSLSWADIASRTVTASGSTDTGSGLSGYRYRTSTDGGTTWSAPVAGSSLVVSAEGETLVQFQSIDNVGNPSAWTPAADTAGATVRLDRTPPTAPAASGGSASWQNASTLPISATGGSDAASGIVSYQYRTSTTGGSTWSSATAGSVVNVVAQGTTLVEFRAVDGVGLDSPWSPISAGGTAMLDQTAPSIPTVTGGAFKYQNLASVTISASGSTDTGGSGLAGYQYRTEFDTQNNTWSAATGGPSVQITAEGLTIVEFRSIDNAGNVSAWAPNPAVPADIVELDRTAPSVPTVSGGSLSWQSAATVTLTASGSSDGLSVYTAGVTGYQYRTSTDGGTTWSAAAAATGSVTGSVTIPTEGTTLVQFRAVDGAGNVSAWTPATPDATDTVMLDHTAPSLPTIGGGTGGSCTAGPVTLTASGSTDALSGFGHYESTVNGAGAVQGPSVTISAHGTSTVKFRAVDAAGNDSAWVTTTVCIS